MEFNIALNTIVYLMLFLFPGILFRKFYFRSAHSKQFDQGNLFERFLWTMLSSICMLMLVIVIFIFVRTILDLPLLKSLTYSNIKSVFNALGANQLPPEEEIEKSYFDFFIFTSALYILSILSGFIFYYINSKITFFKPSNYWENIINGSYKLNNFDEGTIYGYTSADILVDTNDESKLYSGKIVDYYLSQDNKLETVILSDVMRFKKVGDDIIERKIPGDNFCIDTTRILNINLKYISQEKEKDAVVKKIIKVLDIVYLLFLLGLFIIIYLDIDWVVFSSIPKRIVFFLINLIIVSNLFGLLKHLILKEKEKVKPEEIPALIAYLLPYLWLFNLVEWWVVLLLEIPAFALIGYMTNLIKEENVKSEMEKSENQIDL